MKKSFQCEDSFDWVIFHRERTRLHSNKICFTSPFTSGAASGSAMLVCVGTAAIMRVDTSFLCKLIVKTAVSSPCDMCGLSEVSAGWTLRPTLHVNIFELLSSEKQSPKGKHLIFLIRVRYLAPIAIPAVSKTMLESKTKSLFIFTVNITGNVCKLEPKQFWALLPALEASRCRLKSYLGKPASSDLSQIWKTPKLVKI